MILKMYGIEKKLYANHIWEFNKVINLNKYQLVFFAELQVNILI